MIPFAQASHRAQLLRLRALAAQALTHYPLRVRSLRAIHHGENATFELRATLLATPHQPQIQGWPAHLNPDRFLVRVHRHGYNSEADIQSELMWLDALAQRGLPVQRPVLTHDGHAVVTARAPGVEQPRRCTVLRWIDGRFIGRPAPLHMERVGQLTAQLHEHASGWTPPPGFTRRRMSAPQVMDSMLSRPSQQLLQEALSPSDQATIQGAIARCQDMLHALGEAPQVFGLIHSDLHMGNILFRGERALALDFDDCAFGHFLHDVATTLSAWEARPELEAMTTAYARGYARVRPWPPEASALLPQLMLTRRLIMLCWILDRAQDSPRLAAMRQGAIARTLSVIRDAQEAKTPWA